MDISILVSWRNHFSQTAWSAGFCPSCQQVEAVRIEDVVQTVSVWFVPVHKTVIGRIGRCDFCERALQNVVSAHELPVAEWSPQNGLPVLFSKLAIPPEVQLPLGDSDARLQSLLTAATVHSSIINLDVTFGMTTGAICGIITGLAVGYFLFDKGLIQHQMDLPGFMVFFALIIAVLGAIIGAAVYGLSKRGREADRIVGTAANKYPIDLERLEILAQNYGPTVERAVRLIRQRSSSRNAP